jgi:16S rRNA (uracil1498-N3)-methyltransferase
LNLFYQPRLPDGVNYLDAEESRHTVRVLRMQEGDQLSLTDGKGCFYSAKITNPDSKKCEFEILNKEEVSKKKFHVHVAIAPTKNADRIEWFVEKATEIGVDEISFITCKNSERKLLNLERIEKVAISAMKQSQQAWLPRIHEMIPFKEILKVSAEQKFIAHVDASNPKQLHSVAAQGKKYLVLIGPEGDFSNEELLSASEHNLEKVSLGANRLRTETAGIVAAQIFGLINS